MPDVLVLAPGADPVELPLGETGPAEHVRVGVEHAAADRATGRVHAPAELVRRLDADRRRAVLGVAFHAALAGGQLRPDAVAQQVSGLDPVVAAAVDGDREEAVLGRGRAVVVADLGLTTRAPHPPGAVAHRDAVDLEGLAVEPEAPLDAPRLIDVRPVVEGRFLAGQERSAERLEREVERELVPLAAEAEYP